MTAIVLAVLTAIAIVAVGIRKIARRKLVDSVVESINKIQDEAQKKIESMPEVPKKFTKDEVRHALRVIRDSGRK